MFSICVCGGGWGGGEESIHCDFSIIGTLCSMQCKGVVDSTHVALVNACAVSLCTLREMVGREKNIFGDN